MEEYRKSPLYISSLQQYIQNLPNAEKQEIRIYVLMNQNEEYRTLPFFLPKGEKLAENRDLLGRYILAMVNNMIVSFGGESLSLYYNREDRVLSELVTEVIARFQIHNPKNNRSGYGVYINYINRMNTFLHLKNFSIIEQDLKDWVEPESSKIFRIYRP
jgi:hypothetical protein